MESQVSIFEKELESDGLWVRITTDYSIMLCLSSTVIGDFWVVEITHLASNQPTHCFVVAENTKDPNLDPNITQMFSQFTTAFYTARLELQEP